MYSRTCHGLRVSIGALGVVTMKRPPGRRTRAISRTEIAVTLNMLDHLNEITQSKLCLGNPAAAPRPAELDVSNSSSSGAGTTLVHGDEPPGVGRHDLDAVALPCRSRARRPQCAPPRRGRPAANAGKRNIGSFSRDPLCGVNLRHGSCSLFPFHDLDLAALEEHPQRTLENLLAHLRQARHLLRGAVVVQGRNPPLSRTSWSSVCAESSLARIRPAGGLRRCGCPR